MDRDTPRQRDLDAVLKQNGHQETWRQFLLRMRQERHSHTDVAFLLQQQFKFRIDPRSIGYWTKQAETEAHHAKAPGRGLDLGPSKGV
jgi:hypothetical protein